MTPEQSVVAECARRGISAVVSGCIQILEGGESDDALMLALGGPHARLVLAGREGGRAGYWPRVWAMRGLLYVWDDVATRAVIAATNDESWRVREMAAKVCRRHRLEGAFDAVARLQDDPVARVQAAAERAVRMIAR
ncbi:MAG: HEAT repeat domain-containing protein [Candidatus Dormiibacterota bacterium]